MELFCSFSTPADGTEAAANYKFERGCRSPSGFVCVPGVMRLETRVFPVQLWRLLNPRRLVKWWGRIRTHVHKKGSSGPPLYSRGRLPPDNPGHFTSGTSGFPVQPPRLSNPRRAPQSGAVA